MTRSTRWHGWNRVLRINVAMAVSLVVLSIAQRPADAVIGGTSALGNTAVVRLINGTSSCSGALWTNRVVVTAAHCVVTTTGEVTTRPMSIYQPGVNTQQSPQTVSQSAIVTVDGWRKRGEYSQPDDIAFVVLSSELAGGSISRLATTNEVSTWSREGRLVTLLGYGRTTPTSTASPVPNSIDQPLSLSGGWPGSFTATQTSTTGICSGDSGGPVITRVGTEVVLIGINSAASGPCSPSIRPSMTGFMPSAYPDLVKRVLDLTNVTTLPVVTTGIAQGISTTSAILTATAVGNNLLTTTSFTYGVQPDLSGASVTVEAAQVTGSTATAIDAAIVNLVPGTTYYYRANASNLAGSVSGTISQFTTLGGAPIVTSGEANTVSSDAAVLTGTVNANTVATQAFFQYSRMPDFSTLDGGMVAGDLVGNETTSLSATITQLEPGVTYYWRIGGTNAAGTTVGETRSFSTPVFAPNTSKSTNALLTVLLIDRTEVTQTLVAPVAKSRNQCNFNTKTKRLLFGRPGTCRVKITTIRAGVTTTNAYNLMVRQP